MDIGLLGDWSRGGGPLYRRLAERLSCLVRDGDLREGDLLPPERELAAALAVSRSTVVAAYGLLADQSVLTRRQGSGTRVAPGADPAGRASGPEVNDTFGHMLDPDGEVIDLASARIPHCPEIAGVVGSLAGPDLDDLLAGAHGGYQPHGYPPLRRALAGRAAQFLPTTEEQVLLTNGAQEAISLVTSLLVGPGDAVVVEEASYPGALDVFRAAGARVFPASSDDHGVDPADLEQVVTRVRPAMIYLVPTYNNPTGTVLPPDRRRTLVALARRYHVPLVDDLTLSGLHLDADATTPPGLAVYAETGPLDLRTDLVVSIDSLDKLMWGGLRVGWVRATPGMISRLARVKAVSDLGSSPIPQLVATRLIDAGEAMVARRNDALRERFALAARTVDRLFPTWRYVRPRGGTVLWLRLPEGNARSLAALALRHGVRVGPGPSFSPVEAFTDHIRLSFAGPEPALVEGLHRLARAWQAYDPAVVPAAEPMPGPLV